MCRGSDIQSHPSASVRLQLMSRWGPKKVCVPLSCVPPMMSLSGSCALTERLWYWSVPSPPFSDEIAVGTLESQFLQSMRLAPERLRDAHWPETSVNDPLSLHMPPSFAMKTTFGFNGGE